MAVNDISQYFKLGDGTAIPNDSQFTSMSANTKIVNTESGDTFKKVSGFSNVFDRVESHGDAVTYSPQTGFTNEQKAQARANIGAMSADTSYGKKLGVDSNYLYLRDQNNYDLSKLDIDDLKAVLDIGGSGGSGSVGAVVVAGLPLLKWDSSNEQLIRDVIYHEGGIYPGNKIASSVQYSKRVGINEVEDATADAGETRDGYPGCLVSLYVGKYADSEEKNKYIETTMSANDSYRCIQAPYIDTDNGQYAISDGTIPPSGTAGSSGAPCTYVKSGLFVKITSDGESGGGQHGTLTLNTINAYSLELDGYGDWEFSGSWDSGSTMSLEQKKVEVLKRLKNGGRVDGTTEQQIHALNATSVTDFTSSFHHDGSTNPHTTITSVTFTY